MFFTKTISENDVLSVLNTQYIMLCESSDVEYIFFLKIMIFEKQVCSLEVCIHFQIQIRRKQ